MKRTAKTMLNGSCSNSNVRPTRVRWHMVGLLLLVATLTYLDRINIAIAATHIQTEFRFTNVEIGRILSAFVLGYAVFQFPAGVLADRYGSKRMFTLAMMWWSIFTILTAVIADIPAKYVSLIWAFILVRFLVGIGESPALPSANRMLGFWMAPGERAVGTGIFIAGLGLGGERHSGLQVHWQFL
jgi:MFS transporter, ACS family, glucarate transporter